MATATQDASRDGGWFRLDNGIVDDGTWARMGGAGALVYGVLSRLAGRGGGCYPSAEFLAEKTGCGRRQVFRAINKLVSLGVIVRTSGGGRKTPNQYTICHPETVTERTRFPSGNSDTADTVSGQKQGPICHKNSDTADTVLRHKTQIPAAAGPASPSAASAASAGSLKEDKQQPQQRPQEGKNDSGGKTTDPAVADLTTALAAAGIGKPVRAELANRPLTPAQIRDAKSSQPNVRLLVLDLRALADQAEAKAQEPHPFDARWDEIGRKNRAEAQRDQAERDAFGLKAMGEDAMVVKHYHDHDHNLVWKSLGGRRNLRGWDEVRFDRAVVKLAEASKQYAAALAEIDREAYPRMAEAV